MKKGKRLIKRAISLLLVLLFSINSFAAIVSDNDGSAFITKTEFDSLKNDFQSQIDNYNTSIDSKIDGAIAAYLSGIKLTNVNNISNTFKVDAKNGIGKPIFFLGPGNQKDYYQNIYLKGEHYNYLPYAWTGESGGTLENPSNYSTSGGRVSPTSTSGALCANFALPKWKYDDYIYATSNTLYSNNNTYKVDDLLLEESDGYITNFDTNCTKVDFSIFSQGCGLMRNPLTVVVKLSDDQYDRGFRPTSVSWWQTAYQTSFNNNNAMKKDLAYLKKKSLIDYEDSWSGQKLTYSEVINTTVINKKKINKKTWLPFDYTSGLILGNKFEDKYMPVVSNDKDEWTSITPVDHKNDYDYKGWLKLTNVTASRYRNIAYDSVAPASYVLFELSKQKNSFNSYWDLKVKAFTSDELKHATGGSGYCYEGLPFFFSESDSGKCTFEMKVDNFLEDKNKNYYLYVRSAPFPKTFDENFESVSNNQLVKLTLNGKGDKVTKVKLAKDTLAKISFDAKKQTQYFLQIIGEDNKFNGVITYFSDFKFESNN